LLNEILDKVLRIIKYCKQIIYGLVNISKEINTHNAHGNREMQEMENKEKEEYEKKSEEEYRISKRTLLLVAGGALGALAVIGIARALKKKRPQVVGIVKEGYAFKEWVASNIESTKEDVEDIVAEAKHEYYKELEATAESINKEKELLQKIEEKVREKIERSKAEEGGA